MTISNCPQCGCEYTYFDGTLNVCPECAYEWHPDSENETHDDHVVYDMHKTKLVDGDHILVMKDLKVKGSSGTIKQGTKVKNIRLDVEALDGHNLDCRVDGFGSVKLKSEFVKKIQ